MKTTISLLTVAAASLAAGAAFAHASFANGPVDPESYVTAVLQVPHGCDGKATNEVQVKLPEGFVFAKPMPKPGWELDVIKGDYQKAYDNHGKKVTSGPVEIRWKNGSLPDDNFDTFTINGKVSGVEAGKALAFVTTQLCGKDGKVVWDQVAADGADPHSVKSPAPLLHVAADDVAAAPAGMHGGHHMDAPVVPVADAGGHQMHAAMAGSGMGVVDPGGMEPAKVGDLELTAGFTKAMLPGQPVGGGFVVIKNTGSTDDVLVAAESAVADHVELHEMAMENDVMKMRPVKDGIPVPAGETVELKPGGLHMMFMGVKEPFVEGGTVKVKLTFEKAGSVDLVLPVGPAAGKKM